MSNNKKYWKNLAELDSADDNVFDKLQNKEFVEEIIKIEKIHKW